MQAVTIHRPGEPVRNEHDDLVPGKPKDFRAFAYRVGTSRSREIVDDRQTLVTTAAALFPPETDIRETDEVSAWVGTKAEKRFRVTGVMSVASPVNPNAVSHIRADLEAVS